MNFDFGLNFSGFFVLQLLTNERASDCNISGAYTRGSKEDIESVFEKIPYEHTSAVGVLNALSKFQREQNKKSELQSHNLPFDLSEFLKFILNFYEPKT